MSMVHTPLAALNTDVIDECLGYLSFPELQAFGSQCRLHRAWFINFVNHRRMITIAIFVSDPRSFNDLLRATSSAISGLIARALFEPASSHIQPAKLMHVNITSEHLSSVMRYLRADGYAMDTSTLDVNTYSDTAIQRTMSAHRGRTEIAITVSRISPAIRSVFQGPTTSYLNWITTNSYFCVYPQLMSQNCALVNSMAMKDGRQHPGQMVYEKRRETQLLGQGTLRPRSPNDG
ncbi:hypothetical protein BV22DRAFT_1128634 [Leucogyrophana mollusca]|uniref:Uncharacterized protein n=1 Tax=Leucogyrophana mollusca TaxID=85980 RepID=A0ACB8BLW4_9AGAM|nr:hypothetical protein BV22DRAFT_1128634 [Leucogyrophana mollusca]